MLRKIHLILGLLTIVAFILSGQYMDRYYGHLANMEPAPRLLFRSSHIYLLFSGLLNCLAGLNRATPTEPWRRAAGLLGSLLLLATPPLFVLAFFYEPWLTGLARPYARIGIYLSLAAVLFQMLARATSFNPQKPEIKPC